MIWGRTEPNRSKTERQLTDLPGRAPRRVQAREERVRVSWMDSQAQTPIAEVKALSLLLQGSLSALDPLDN
jgi:hypothetical protein